MSKFYDLLESLIGKVNKSVKTDAQTLTESQKAQARANIGAAAVGEGGGGGTVSGGTVSGDAVLYTEQTLTDEQKTQARSNIGAVSTDELPSQLEITKDESGQMCTHTIYGKSETFSMTSEDCDNYFAETLIGTPMFVKYFPSNDYWLHSTTDTLKVNFPALGMNENIPYSSPEEMGMEVGGYQAGLVIILQGEVDISTFELISTNGTTVMVMDVYGDGTFIDFEILHRETLLSDSINPAHTIILPYKRNQLMQIQGELTNFIRIPYDELEIVTRDNIECVRFVCTRYYDLYPAIVFYRTDRRYRFSVCNWDGVSNYTYHKYDDTGHKIAWFVNDRDNKINELYVKKDLFDTLDLLGGFIYCYKSLHEDIIAPVPTEMYIKSSTEGSIQTFKITVNDSGTLTVVKA